MDMALDAYSEARKMMEPGSLEKEKMDELIAKISTELKYQ